MSEEKKKAEEKTIEEKKVEFEEMKAETSNSMVITVNSKDGREYKFFMPFNSPLQECYHAAINTANEIARLFKEAIEKQKEKADEKEAAEKKENKEAK